MFAIGLSRKISKVVMARMSLMSAVVRLITGIALMVG